MIYLTLEEANTYFSSRFGVEEWDYSTDEKRTKALNTAESNILKLPFAGLRNDSANVFPRDGEDAIPDRVKEAMYEEALSLLTGNSNTRDLADLHVTSSSVAGFSTTVDAHIDRPWLIYNLTSPVAWLWLTPYLIDPRTFNIARA